MDKQRVIGSAVGHIDWLHQNIDELTLSSSAKSRASSACLGIAQEHHHGIVILVDNGVFAPATALVRAAFEAYVCGVWLWRCATEQQAESFLSGDPRPKIDRLLRSIEKDSATDEKYLTKLKTSKWGAMSGFLHTNGVHAQRWMKDGLIQSSYEEDELRSIIEFAELVGCLSAIGLCDIAGDDQLSDKVLAKWKDWNNVV